MTGPSIQAGVFFEIEETGKKKKAINFEDQMNDEQEKNALFVTVDPECESE